MSAAASCGDGKKLQGKFEEIDRVSDIDARKAMSMLDSIDYASLQESERHRYDLLHIKTRDKAYVTHTSDSLVLDVIDYYADHRKEGLYPEALYYGGRVYSDMGDLPTALEYFQKAIDATPDDKTYLRFKGIVFNQTGRLLHSLRLDLDAIEYLEKSLKIAKQLNESDYILAFTHELLGNSYLNINDIKNARRNIDKAVMYSSSISDSDRASILIDFSRILAIEEKSDSALSVIRPLPSLVDTLALSRCLALASEIYRDAGILDTAYMYARQLTRLKEPSNQRTGYKVIFSDELRNYVSEDTLIALLPEYKGAVESFLDSHEGENVIMQNTRYNYSVHERKRMEAEKRLYFYAVISALAIIASLILLSIQLYRKFRKADTEVGVVTAINIMKESPVMYIDRSEIKTENPVQALMDDSGSDCKDAQPTQETCIYPESADADNHEKLADIKDRILSEIRAFNGKDEHSLVNPAILASQIYISLRDKLESQNHITYAEEKSVYKSLEELIESISEGFFYRLNILTEGMITDSERKMAMLIKCGFSPLQISVLLGREKNTISTHRRNLAFKISGLKKADYSLDLIIISL